MRSTIFAILITVALGIPLHAVVGGPVVDGLISWADSDGYVPVVLTISSPAERTFTITVQGGGHTATATAQVGAGETRRVTVPLPPIEDRSPSANLQWTTDDGLNGAGSASCQIEYRHGAVVIVDPSERAITKDRFPVVAASGWDNGLPYSAGDLVLRTPVENLPDRWQTYPTWMTLAIAAAEDRRLTAEQRTAIAAWTRVGGLLMVEQAAQAAVWRGLGVEAVPIDRSDAMDRLKDHLASAMRQLANRPAIRPVPGTNEVPTGGFLLLAIVFAVLVGPINLLWVRRRGANQLFLLTTPVLSLATCILLLGADLVLQGVGMRRVADQLVVLDQVAGQAAIWTRATYYGGFSVAGFPLDGDSSVERFDDLGLLYPHGYSTRGRSTPDTFSLDWRGGLSAGPGWIPARTNQQLRYRSVRPERSQIRLDRVGNALRVTNGLGAPLVSFEVTDGKGVVWSTGPIGFGETADLAQGAGADLDIVTGGTVGTFGGDAQRVWTAMSGPWTWRAQMAGSFGGLPGPEGKDVEPLRTWLAGRVTPSPGVER